MKALAATLVLLLIAVPLPASAQSGASEAWSQADASGDFRVMAGGQASPPFPLLPGLEALDVRGLTIDDPDGERFILRLATGGPISVGFMAGYVSNLGEIQVTFKLPGSSSYGFLRVFVMGTMENNTVKPFVYRGSYCNVQNLDAARCFGLGDWVETVSDGSVLRFVLPKTLLTQRSFGFGGAQDVPARLQAGDELTSIRVVSEVAPFLGFIPMPGALYVADVAPDGAAWPAYKIRYPSSLPDLVLNTSQVGIIAGEESLIHVGLKNLNDRKRLVNLSVHVDSADKPGWQASITPFVTVSAKNSTTVLLRVKAPPTEGAAVSAQLRIVASVVSEGGDQASLIVPLTASAPLDAGSSRYFVHSQGWESPVQNVVNDLHGVYGGASRKENDPQYRDRWGLVMAAFNPFPGQPVTLRSGFPSLEPFPNPVRVSGGTAKMHLNFDSPGAMAGRLTLRVFLGFNRQSILQLEKDVSLVPGKQDIDLEGPMPAIRLPAGTIAWPEITFRTDSPHAALSAAGAPRLKITPKVSWFELPFQRDRELEQVLKGPRVVLAPTEDLDEFVHPGYSIVFEMDLRNEEPIPQRVEVGFENLTEAWTAAALPGPRYTLKPNESAHIGIRITAPPTAKEGEQISPRILVRGVDDQQVYHAVRLVLTAVNVAEARNDTFSYSPEDAAKLDVAPKAKSGAPSLWLALCALAVALQAGRRNRT